MTMTDEVMLVVEGGSHSDEEIPLSGPTTTMGRQSTNDVVVAEAGVSRKHAEISQIEEGYNLRDLGSTNGTFVNDKNIDKEEYLLQDGDSIRLGASKVSYIFRSPSANTMSITLEQAVVDPSNGPGGSESPATMVTEIVGPAGPSGDDELFEGTVLLRVTSKGSMGLVVTFVQQLREKPEFRLLRMENSRDGSTNIWLALREPVALRDVLGDIEGVAETNLADVPDAAPGSDDAPITVVLEEG